MLTPGCPRVILTWFQRLNRKYIDAVSNSASNFNLRHYSKTLGSWVATQRKWHRAGKLRDDRKHALDQLGFDWYPSHAAKMSKSFRAVHVRQIASPWALGVSDASSSAEDGGSGKTQPSVTWIGPDDLSSSRDGDEEEGSRLDVSATATGAAAPSPVVGGWGKGSSAYEEKQQFVFSHIHGWWKGDGGVGGDESRWGRDTRGRVRAMRQGLTLVHFSAQPKPFWSLLPVSPCLINWGKIMHPTHPTQCAYVEPKNGRV